MKLTSKIMGTFRSIFSIMWMGLGVLGMVYGLRGIDWTEDRLNQSTTAVVENIDLVNDLLMEVVDVIDKVEISLSTAERSSLDAGLAIGESRPMIDKVSQIVAQDVPQALDEVQTSMPSVIEAAAMVDQTLTLLSKFQFNIPNPFGSDWVISLGVDYDPPVPLEEALTSLSGHLEGIPENMRAIEGDLVTADINMAVMSEDLIDVAYDLDLMRGQLADINPGIEGMIASLAEVQTSMKETQGRIAGAADRTRKLFTGVMVLLILSQIPSAYIGYLMTTEQFQASRPALDESVEEKVESKEN
jgi:hypothetical protein